MITCKVVELPPEPDLESEPKPEQEPQPVEPSADWRKVQPRRVPGPRAAWDLSAIPAPPPPPPKEPEAAPRAPKLSSKPAEPAPTEPKLSPKPPEAQEPQDPISGGGVPGQWTNPFANPPFSPPHRLPAAPLGPIQVDFIDVFAVTPTGTIK
jgi:hypothetical protein